MARKVIEASEAVAVAAKLCRVEVVPVYPITPQTHIPKKIADMVSNGEMNIRMINVESEHSALSAAIGSEAVGSRTFTATSSQGLALMHEIVFIASGMRLPIVMVVANRALSAPLNIWNDQQDSISERDSGWIQFYVESAQEAFDTVIMAYKIAENAKVMTPVMVCMDGFALTHVFEPVDIRSQEFVDRFLPKLSLPYPLNPEKPVSMGPIVYPTHYIHVKKQQQDAIVNSINEIKKTHEEFSKLTKIDYGDGLTYEFQLKGADYVIVAMGTICSTIKSVVADLRKKGKNVGLLKIKTLRPFPEKNVVDALKNAKAIAVIDRNISLGNDGALYTDVKSALYNKSNAVIHNFIAALGGKDFRVEDAVSIFNKIEKEKKELREWVL